LVNGFISKEMFLTETLQFHTGSIVDRLLPILATLGSAFSVLYSVRLIHQVFFGPPATDLPRKPHEPVVWMRLPVEVLVLVCLVVGISPARTIGRYLERAVRSVLGDATPDYSLTIWHGVTPALMLSMAALAGGVLLYVIFRRYLSASPDQGPAWTGRLRARRVFELALLGLFNAAGAMLKVFGTRRLQPQMLVLIFVAIFAGVLPFFITYVASGAWGFTFGGAAPTPVDPLFILIWALAAIFAVASAYLAKFHRLAALILMGGTGLMSCLTFVWLSAPDLAVTQLLVEVVTTVLLLLGLRWIPKRVEAPELAVKGWRPQFRRVRDFTVAAVAGTGVALLSYAAMTRDHPGGISSFFLENSYAGAGGRNVVNVLLVDFRGFDTMGEITVLGIVALTVFALLRRFRPARELVGAPKQQQRQNAYDHAAADRQVGDTGKDYLHVPRVVMHLMFPVLTVFAIYLFLRN